MYGTIARFRLKQGMEGKLAEELCLFDTATVTGFIRTHLYRMDTDPLQYYMVVVFENKETYLANADSPEQDARYRRMAELLDGELDWNDGEVIYASP